METTHNYPRADAPLQEAAEERETAGGGVLDWDEDFWQQAFAVGDGYGATRSRFARR